MSSSDIRVPEGIGEDDAEIVVAGWSVENGGHVDAGEVVCELMVTKVTFEVEAPAAGRLEQIAVVEDVVSVGTVIGKILPA